MRQVTRRTSAAPVLQPRRCHRAARRAAAVGRSWKEGGGREGGGRVEGEWREVERRWKEVRGRMEDGWTEGLGVWGGYWRVNG